MKENPSRQSPMSTAEDGDPNGAPRPAQRFAHYFAVFSNAPDAIVIVDDKGTIREINRAAESLLGYTRSELAGERIEQLVPEASRASHRDLRRAFDKHPTARLGDRRLTALAKSGEEIPVEIHLGPADVNGATWTIATLHDERDRVALLQDTLERQDRLQRSEEKYSRIFNTSPLAITVSTLLDGVFREANSSCQSVFGYSREELLGKSAFELGIWVDTADREELVRRVREVPDPAPVFTHLRRKDGSVRPVEIFGAIYEVDGVEHLMGLTMDVSERVAFEAELERQTLYDGVTGLPNRVLFQERLQRALEQNDVRRNSVAVVTINLDRFKVINETMGHGAGDDLLLAVANRLRDIIRAPHTVARFSADEFYLLLEDPPARKDALALVRQSLAIFETPFRLLGTEVHMTASAGVALSSTKIKSADELLRHANLALSLAKRNPDLDFHVFDPKQDMEIAHRFRRETQLWQALERDEFRLHFQPVFNLATQQITGAEALVRWNHPTDGLLNPGDFIPIAEESALIISISEWVKTTAARYAADLIRATRRDDFVMSVNVSARHFMRPYLVQKVKAMLQESGLPAANFEIEVTETVVLRSPEQVEALRDLGVHIAVDDLGTGFSSLEYLTQMNVDTLKVDRVLIEKIGADPRSTAVVEAIKLIGERLNVRVIAEGIETQRQLAVLRNLGYEYGQGFLLGRPMSGEQLTKLLVDGSGSVIDR